jgi:hypothetical protein
MRQVQELEERPFKSGAAQTLADRVFSNNSYNSLYLMGVYNSSNGKYTTPFSEKLLVDAFKKAGKRLDMGKCCLHFKELDDLELTSVAKVIAMSTPKEYIAYYKRVKGLA